MCVYNYTVVDLSTFKFPARNGQIQLIIPGN